jgi:hypothetical protein
MVHFSKSAAYLVGATKTEYFTMIKDFSVLSKASETISYNSGNPDGIYWSMVICFGIAAALLAGYYASGRWKKSIVVKLSNAQLNEQNTLKIQINKSGNDTDDET